MRFSQGVFFSVKPFFKKKFIRSGNMEIYEMTYEGILFKIKAEEEKKVCLISKKDNFSKFST